MFYDRTRISILDRADGNGSISYMFYSVSNVHYPFEFHIKRYGGNVENGFLGFTSSSRTQTRHTTATSHAGVSETVLLITTAMTVVIRNRVQMRNGVGRKTLAS